MLDPNLKDQITELFKELESRIEFSFAKTDHADQSQLLDLLNDVASVSDKLTLKENESHTAAFPEFKLLKNDNETGIQFKGIPSGHEFSSFILAILHVDGKGRQFDAGITQKVRRLKGPVRISTYVSLTCENCPDVVQALNQMAVLHDDFQHTMIDGAYVQDEIQKLGIQGVPSVVVNGKLIHSGKVSIGDLLTKLEDTFGLGEDAEGGTIEKDLGLFDVVVIGAGPAGASAAIYSARKGLKTAVVADKVGGQVQETKGIENLVSVTYTEGPVLSGQLLNHMQQYPIQIFEHRRVKNIEADDSKNGHNIQLESGEELKAKKIILATGAKWRELNIPGEKEYLGQGVAFCPHCDGPFYKGKKVAVIGGGNSGVEAAIDLAGIVSEVVLVEYGDKLKADQVLVQKLQSLPNASILTSAKTKEIVGDGKKVNKLVYENLKTEESASIDLDGVFVQIGLLPNSSFVKEFVKTNKAGEIIVDEKGRTSVPGIYAAGDVTITPYKQIIIAMGDGAKVALAAFEDQMYA